MDLLTGEIHAFLNGCIEESIQAGVSKAFVADATSSPAGNAGQIWHAQVCSAGYPTRGCQCMRAPKP